MNNLTLALDGAWKVLLTSLVLGAGLPVLFAAGVRSLASGRTVGSGDRGASEVSDVAPNPFGRALAALCFVVVLAGVTLGITIVVASGFGKAVSFAHVYPTIVSK